MLTSMIQVCRKHAKLKRLRDLFDLSNDNIIYNEYQFVQLYHLVNYKTYCLRLLFIQSFNSLPIDYVYLHFMSHFTFLFAYLHRCV